MKNLNQIQEENRRAITVKIYVEDLIESDFDKWHEMVKFYFRDEIDESRVDLLASEISLKIANRRLSLDKVLLVTENQIGFDEERPIESGYLFFFYAIGKPYIAWDLTKPTLEDQTEECQRQVHKLLMGE